eukprot:1159666-Pelagomonas_calceolata.AAC.9
MSLEQLGLGVNTTTLHRCAPHRNLKAPLASKVWVPSKACFKSAYSIKLDLIITKWGHSCLISRGMNPAF